MGAEGLKPSNRHYFHLTAACQSMGWNFVNKKITKTVSLIRLAELI